jgi:predicted dehydrogenase
MRKVTIIILALTIAIHLTGQPSRPVKLGIAGLSHSHVQPLLRNMKSPYFEIVGIYESNSEMAGRYAKTYKFDTSLIYSSLEEMLDKTKPEGVLTFTSIYDHLKVVESCAPRGINVMVEKPLAVSTGYIFSDDAQNIRYKFSEKAPEIAIKLPLRDAPFNDPFTFFSAAIRGGINIPENDLSSLKTNLTVVEIIEAAVESSKTGKPV